MNGQMARRLKGRLLYVAIFALACVVEWAAQQVKTWAGNKITEKPGAPGKDER